MAELFFWRDEVTTLVHRIDAEDPRPVPQGEMWGVERTFCGIEPPDGAPIYRDLTVTCALCHEAVFFAGLYEPWAEPISNADAVRAFRRTNPWGTLGG